MINLNRLEVLRDQYQGIYVNILVANKWRETYWVIDLIASDQHLTTHSVFRALAPEKKSTQKRCISVIVWECVLCFGCETRDASHSLIG